MERNQRVTIVTGAVGVMGQGMGSVPMRKDMPSSKDVAPGQVADGGDTLS